LDAGQVAAITALHDAMETATGNNDAFIQLIKDLHDKHLSLKDALAEMQQLIAVSRTGTGG
jgi:hypothetical protein